MSQRKKLLGVQVLTLVCLSGNSITSVGAVAMCEGVAVNQSLAAVYLDHNDLGNTGAEAILKCLEKNAGIVHFRMDNTNCADHLRITIDLVTQLRRE